MRVATATAAERDKRLDIEETSSTYFEKSCCEISRVNADYSVKSA
jgi:hypothetical protein